MTGEEAVEKGYKQVSRRYRLLAKLPDGVDPIEFVRMHLNQFYQTLWRMAESQALRCGDVRQVELSEEEFASFRKHGGQVA